MVARLLGPYLIQSESAAHSLQRETRRQELKSANNWIVLTLQSLTRGGKII